jgi:hypothetical protein
MYPEDMALAMLISESIAVFNGDLRFPVWACQFDVNPYWQANSPNSTNAGQCNSPLDFKFSVNLCYNIFSANEL